MRFSDYAVEDFFDEVVAEDGSPRAAARLLVRDIETLAPDELRLRQQAAELALVRSGITFNVYSDSQGLEKTLPFDLIPRIVSAREWDRIEQGLKQRVYALNEFLQDVYHEQKQVAADALYRAAEAYYKQAKTAEYDQSVSGKAIATFSDLARSAFSAAMPSITGMLMSSSTGSGVVWS